jgi:hypothetical protein
MKYISHLFLLVLPENFINRSIFNVFKYITEEGEAAFPHAGWHQFISKLSTVHTMSNPYNRLNNCLITQDTIT